MGEQTIYQQQVLAEIVTAVGMGPDVTLDQIEQRLGTLYVQHQHANDDAAMLLINEAWEKIQSMAQTTGKAIDIAAAAREMLTQTVGQRDAVIAEHQTLKKAIQDADVEHPDLSDLVEAVQEMIEDDLMASGVYMSPNPGEDIVNNAMIDVSETQAEIFHDALTGQRLYDLDDETAEMLRRELKDFITQFVWKVYCAELERDKQLQPVSDDTEDWSDES